MTRMPSGVHFGNQSPPSCCGVAIRVSPGRFTSDTQIRGKDLWKYFERIVAMQGVVARAPHFPHPAFAEQCSHFVGTDATAQTDGHR